jgi:uncharacterized membrane protein YgaE (UPF0421/DUF939 family)
MSFLSEIQADRNRDRQSLIESAAYAAQAVVAVLLVTSLYRWWGKGSAMWAAVSAVLVLQPRFRRSIAASAIRVIANLLGAGIGVLLSLVIPERAWAVSISLVLIVLACEYGKLDAGVRSACASVLIVTMVAGGSVVARGWERASAVCIGCGVALVLQFAVYALVRAYRARPDFTAARPAEDSE